MSSKKPRKHRVGEVNCWCPAYRFPHRKFGGKCDGKSWVTVWWEQHFGTGPCRECTLLDTSDDNPRCQVNEGAEPPKACPLIQEVVARHEIKLYGWRWL